jgi:hypothetical protein
MHQLPTLETEAESREVANLFQRFWRWHFASRICEAKMPLEYRKLVRFIESQNLAMTKICCNGQLPKSTERRSILRP